MTNMTNAIRSVLMSDYATLLWADLDEGSAELIDIYDEGYLNEAGQRRMEYDLLIRTIVEEEVIEGEREIMLLALSRDYLKWNLNRNNVISRVYLNKEGNYCEMKCVRIPSEEGRNLVSIALSNNDEEIRNKIEFRRKKNFQASLMDGLSKEYHSVWLIHSDRSMELFRASSMTGSMKAVRLGMETGDYSLALPLFVERFVAPSDRLKILTECTYYKLMQSIPDDDILPFSFKRIDDNGNERFYQVVYSRAKDEDGESNIVMAFRDVDKLIREQMEAEERFLHVVKERDMDGLTGMNNRLCYERKLKEYVTRDNLNISCVYIDVNGLHELNNTKGHDVGDRMLISVADIIMTIWGDEDTFRIGGDEFAAFKFDTAEKYIQEDIDRLNSQVEAAGYHISIGSSTEYLKDLDIRQFIKSAEDKMYAAKRAFYAGTNDRRRR